MKIPRKRSHKKLAVIVGAIIIFAGTTFYADNLGVSAAGLPLGLLGGAGKDTTKKPDKNGGSTNPVTPIISGSSDSILPSTSTSSAQSTKTATTTEQTAPVNSVSKAATTKTGESSAKVTAAEAAAQQAALAAQIQTTTNAQAYKSTAPTTYVSARISDTLRNKFYQIGGAAVSVGVIIYASSYLFTSRRTRRIGEVALQSRTVTQ